MKSIEIQNKKKLIPFFILLSYLIFDFISFFGDLFNLLDYSDGNKTLIYLGIMILLTAASLTVALFDNAVFKKILGIIVYALSPVAIFFLTEYFIHNPISGSPKMSVTLIIINVAIYAIIELILFIFTTSSAATVIISSVVFGLFGFANFLSVSCRSIPIYPWDIYSFGTAVSVLDNYTITYTNTIYFIVFCFLFLILVTPLLNVRFRLKKYYIQSVIGIICIALSVGFFGYLRTNDAQNKYNYYPYLFSEFYLYKSNGTALTMIWSSKYLSVDKPSGYSLEELDKLYQENKNDDKADDSKSAEVSIENPNVIVIMNEAFTDIELLGLDFSVNTDYMPFIHSLKDDDSAKVGTTWVSVLGGNTPNSEFEFLTGMSMAFLPSGSIPYQQFITSDLPTIVSQFEALGYSTTAIHPYNSNGWRRNVIYPLFGFDNILFSTDIKYQKRIRSYISDETMFDCIIDSIEDQEKPLFLFGVTMQNHGGYTTEYEDFTSDITVDGVKSKALSQYLSLIKISDSAFEDLIEYIDEYVDEPTVVVMFGDHQPNPSVFKPLYTINNREYDLVSYETVTVQQFYKTPYIIWSNYDLDLTACPDNISINYLASMLVNTVGLETTPFQNWQLEIINDYPTINAGSYYSSQDGKLYSTQYYYNVDTLNLYSKIQYNYLFGGSSRITEFFSLK